MKESFIVYHEIAAQTATMTDEQVGQLFRAMLCYSMGGEPEFSSPLVSLAFSFVKPTMERDKRKYEAVCEAHREAGRKGGRPRKHPIVHGGGDFLPKNQMEAKKPDNVYVNVHDNDNDSDNDKDFFTHFVRKEVLDCQDSLDAQPAQNAQPQDGQTQDTQTEDARTQDDCERAFQDALRYAEKVGYQLTAKQRRRLRQWCQCFPYHVVALAIDRALYYGGQSVTYVFRVLQEWQDLGLRDEYEVTTYLEARERLVAIEGQAPGLLPEWQSTA
ncbi:MAG: DUF6291 domain-containing protein [Clostridiales bacterium]|nr:DUF6291 domain-containing protein [Clostridiales bacterium]